MTGAGVARHLLIGNLADRFVRAGLNDCSPRAGGVISGCVPLNMDSSIALGLINASDAGSSRQHASAGGNKNAAATKAVVAGLSVDQHYIAGVRLIL
jgi:hypothetical protein